MTRHYQEVFDRVKSQHRDTNRYQGASLKGNAINVFGTVVKKKNIIREKARKSVLLVSFKFGLL
jgi:hypothetical protein